MTMFRFFLLVSALGLVLVGCSGQKASVSGTVQFKGQPLPSGTVLFHSADGRVEHSFISAGGKYTLSDAPIGTVRITVQSHGAASSGLPSKGGDPPPLPPELVPRPQDRRDTQYVAIPLRYEDSEKSGLAYTVRAGTQSHNIELEP